MMPTRPPRLPRAAAALVALAALLVLAGALLGACASTSQGPSAGGPATTTTAAPPATTSTPPATTPGGTPTTTSATLVATGTVSAGVEPGCILLDTAKGQRYLLEGGGTARNQLVDGTRVQVVGRLAPDHLSYCQQGTILVVLSVKPLRR